MRHPGAGSQDPEQEPASPGTPPMVPSERTRLEERLEASRRLMDALTQVHVDLVTQGDHRALFGRLLTLMLQETQSEYGFIAEILRSPEGQPYLRSYALTNIAWTDELRAIYATSASQGLEFRNMDTLFGAVVTSGQPLLTNDAPSHPSAAGVPPGHPPLRVFLGVPFSVHGELVGMVGIANRPGGYEEDHIEFLKPLLTTCGIITYARRSEVRRREAEQALEEQRRRQQEELEERVRLVTRELEARQAQLIQAEKLASLGQMAASIAHEINNPVSYVASNVSTLDEYIRVLLQLIGLYHQVEQGLGSSPPETVAGLLEQVREVREKERLEEILQDLKELLGDSREGISRIREFVQSLKTFVREESGTPQLADLNQVLQTTLRMLRHEFKHKCEVRTELASLPLLRCFPTQLNQVFTNLLMNAAQAIEQWGEIRITSGLEGSEAVVRITDTGRGMGSETLAKLFTPFFTTKPAGQGTGLGLSICYVIIGRHKGRIDVES
ncbi:GAF domain-containing protein, partial [Hyalangium sp.]|uniref:GAF domain-containing protein n=1 Tax=Hyalangium sp. TaxID=2028555 RepID=UPI002D5D8A6C